MEIYLYIWLFIALIVTGIGDVIFEALLKR